VVVSYTLFDCACVSVLILM